MKNEKYNTIIYIMKVDRRYLLLGPFNRQSQQADGSDFWLIDLRDILGYLYDKYNKFNLKLEAYQSRTAAGTSLPYEIQFLHVGGFPWSNGYDTNPNYNSTRVAAVTMFDHNFGTEYLRNMLYPSNIATLTFYRQATSRIRMELFATVPDSNTKITPLFGNEGGNWFFSITGVEDKYSLYRQPEIIERTSQFVLNTANASSLEVNNRAIRWSNIDLSKLIDVNIYYKYDKFVLSLKMVQIQVTTANFSAWIPITFMVSGLTWASATPKFDATYIGDTTFLQYHQGPPTAIGLLDTQNGDLTKETFIDNVFYKPNTPRINLSMTYSKNIDLSLIGVSGPVVNPFLFIFNILPVSD